MPRVRVAEGDESVTDRLTPDHEANIRWRDRLWSASTVFPEGDEPQRDRHVLLVELDVVRGELDAEVTDDCYRIGHIDRLKAACRRLAKQRDEAQRDAVALWDWYGEGCRCPPAGMSDRVESYRGPERTK